MPRKVTYTVGREGGPTREISVDVQTVRSDARAPQGERVYLTGDFVVTASGENRARNNFV